MIGGQLLPTERDRLTRSELYQLVWSIPVLQLSKQFGISNVGLSKICKRYNIPRPPRGYWAKIESGQKIKKTRLPAGNNSEIIEIKKYPNISNPETHLAGLPSDDIQVKVPDSLRGAHPLVKQSSETLKSVEPDHLGILMSQKGDCLDISVSKKALRRALLIMEGLIRALESLEGHVFLDDESTQVKILDLTIQISMSEEIMTEYKEPKKHDLSGYYQFGHSQRLDSEQVPSGKICLTIE